MNSGTRFLYSVCHVSKLCVNQHIYTAVQFVSILYTLCYKLFLEMAISPLEDIAVFLHMPLPLCLLPRRQICWEECT